MFHCTHAVRTGGLDEDDEEGSLEVPPAPARSDDDYVGDDDSASDSGTACMACMRSCVASITTCMHI